MILKVYRKTGQFVQIANDTLRDRRLSWKARGLLAFMLTHSHEWRFSAERLTREGPDGRDAVLSAMKELEATGYLVRVKRRGPRGHFQTEVHVGETPDMLREIPDQPSLGYPASDCPVSDNPLPIEHNQKNTISRKPDILWEAFVQIHGEPASKSERGKFNQIVAKLKEADVTADEYPALVQAYTTKHRGLQPAPATVAERVGELRHYLERGPVQEANALRGVNWDE